MILWSRVGEASLIESWKFKMKKSSIVLFYGLKNDFLKREKDTIINYLLFRIHLQMSIFDKREIKFLIGTLGIYGSYMAYGILQESL